jgi:A/G-specific adenine glycosylase
LVVRRPAQGLLGGMWQFPGGESVGGASDAEDCRLRVLAATGLDVRVVRHLMQVRHSYTHFRARMDLFACLAPTGRVCLENAAAYRWLLPEELTTLAFGAAEKQFIPILDEGPDGGPRAG